MHEKSRADYFKERRKTIGQFSVSVSREKLDALDTRLKEDGKTKTGWLEQKINKEVRGMLVLTREETVEEKRQRHIKEMIEEQKGWVRELDWAIEKGYHDHEKFCRFMLDVTENTLERLRNYQ